MTHTRAADRLSAGSLPWLCTGPRGLCCSPDSIPNTSPYQLSLSWEHELLGVGWMLLPRSYGVGALNSVSLRQSGWAGRAYSPGTWPLPPWE